MHGVRSEITVSLTCTKAKLQVSQSLHCTSTRTLNLTALDPDQCLDSEFCCNTVQTISTATYTAHSTTNPVIRCYCMLLTHSPSSILIYWIMTPSLAWRPQFTITKQNFLKCLARKFARESWNSGTGCYSIGETLEIPPILYCPAPKLPNVLFNVLF